MATDTIGELAKHSHTRGTMEITGRVSFRKMGSNPIPTSPGEAFSVDENDSSDTYITAAQNESTSTRTRLTVTASNSWTGSTSSVGNANAHNNLCPYLVVYCWCRTL